MGVECVCGHLKSGGLVQHNACLVNWWNKKSRTTETGFNIFKKSYIASKIEKGSPLYSDMLYSCTSNNRIFYIFGEGLYGVAKKSDTTE